MLATEGGCVLCVALCRGARASRQGACVNQKGGTAHWQGLPTGVHEGESLHQRTSNESLCMCTIHASVCLSITWWLIDRVIATID